MRIALPPHIDAAAFATRDPAARIVDLSGRTMGTGWSVRMALPAGTDPAPLHVAIVARLDGLVAELSQWDPASTLSAFNAAPAGRWIALPSDFAHVVHAALAIARETDGAFDPALGRIVDLWGYGPPAFTGAPDAETLATARAASGWHRLDHDPGARRLRQPGGLALDLSGIAKGHAVDAVADLLHAAGIRHCLVEIGGELAGRGVHPNGDPWWVDLETPPDVDLPTLRLALHGLSVATSGPYRRGPHSIDPRTGHPAPTDILSVSVLHPSAMHADAWATALTVQGAEKGAHHVAIGTRLPARIICRDAGRIREHLSPALEAMLA